MAAEKGDRAAEFNVGVAYQTGDGASMDQAEALRWYLRSAKQGDPQAQICVASMYRRGDGVAKDNVEALRWYREAAEHSAEGQFELGAV